MRRTGKVSGIIATCIAILLMVNLFTLSQTSNAAVPAPGSGGSWTLIEGASDEFDGAVLDDAKWTKGLWYDTSGVLAFKDSNVSVSGGNLILEAKKESHNGKAYTYGAVESKFDVPGVDTYVEVRAKMLNSSANVLSAIWMQSSPLSSDTNPNPEIDIVETFDFYQYEQALHKWWIDPTDPSNYTHDVIGHHKWYTGVDMSADYHTYGLERRNDVLKFYFDGNLAWEMTPSDPSFVSMARHMVLSLEGHLGNPVDNFLPDSFQIDYVRTYQYNSSIDFTVSNGTYQLTNKNSGKALIVPGASTSNGTHLSQGTYSGTDNEKWVLQQIADGYTIQNLNSSLYADIAARSTADGGIALQWSWYGGDNQKWTFEDQGNGYYKIRSNNSGKYLCIENASTSDGAKVVQWTDGSGDHYLWQLNKIEETITNGNYKLTNKNSGKALIVPGASTGNGTHLSQALYSGTDNEKWTLTQIAEGYTIQNVNSGLYADIAARSTADGGIALQWSWYGGDNQKWVLESQSNGYYKIKSVNSGKYLCVENASTADGAKIIQWADGSGDHLLWEVTQVN